MREQVSNKWDRALEKILADGDLRYFFWRHLVDDCKIDQESFPMNAQAYSLLAVQEIGKRLLREAKAVNYAGVVLAEQEYTAIRKEIEEYNNKANQEEEIYG